MARTVLLLFVVVASCLTMAAARLDAASGVECWKANAQLVGCSKEIAQFFVSPKAENSIKSICCGAIDTIASKCSWSGTGVTPSKGVLLKQYCDSSVSPSPTA